MKKLLGLVAICVLSAGCVSQKKFDTLQTQLDATTRALQSQVDERDARIVAAEQQLDAQRKQVSELSHRIAALGADLVAAQKAQATLETERNDLQGQLAQTVKDRSRLKGSIEEMRQALADLKARKAAAETRIASFRALLDRFKTLIDTGRLRVKIVDGRMVVAMATDVLFSSGSASLSKDGMEAITAVAEVLASIPGRQYQVEGHTDDVPMHSAKFRSNWELAASRATTVAKAMIDAGLPPERVSAASYGEYRPAVPNDTKEGRAANRRIEIVVVPDLSTLPGFDDLKRLGAGGEG